MSMFAYCLMFVLLLFRLFSDFQKEGLKELRKPKKDFKPTKVLKILNHKEESTKNSVDKKS